MAQARRVLPDEVAARIQSRIIDGSLRPGDRLPPERELATQLHVNRSSVREALKKLEQLRLVDVQQGSGTRVRDSQHASFDVIWSMLFPDGRANQPLIRDLLEMREAIAPGIMRLALERAAPAQIETGIADLRAAAEPDLSDEGFVDRLRNLQVLLAQLSGNQVLVILANSVTRFLTEHGFRKGTGMSAEERRVLIPLILRLAVAMEARDGETSERTLREIMRRLTEAVLGGLERAADTEES